MFLHNGFDGFDHADKKYNLLHQPRQTSSFKAF